MSKHLFGIIATHHGAAANNRGTNDGNITTLQKLLWNGELHTTVSAEAIRWAIRYYWQNIGLPVNRRWDEALQDHDWQHKKGDGKKARVHYDPEIYIDDDLMGFMLAEAAKAEGNEAEAGKKAKGTTDKRRGPLEISRAVSLSPFAGDITFNAKSGEKGSTSLYGTEVHATRYQYGFAFTPQFSQARKAERTIALVQAIVGLGEVAGNHARFLYDFAPESVIFRWTDDFAPRFLYGYQQGPNGSLSIPQVMQRIRSGDIAPQEVIVGGSIASTSEGAELIKLGASVHDGVKAAADALQKRIQQDIEQK